MLLASLDLASTAEAVTVLGFAGGVGAWITQRFAKRRKDEDATRRETKESDEKRAKRERDVDDALFGAKGDPRLNIPDRVGVIQQQAELTKATRELTAAVADIRAQLAEHIEGHMGAIG